jgi:hypothetical protein
MRPGAPAESCPVGPENGGPAASRARGGPADAPGPWPPRHRWGSRPKGAAPPHTSNTWTRPDMKGGMGVGRKKARPSSWPRESPRTPWTSVGKSPPPRPSLNGRRVELEGWLEREARRVAKPVPVVLEAQRLASARGPSTKRLDRPQPRDEVDVHLNLIRHHRPPAVDADGCVEADLQTRWRVPRCRVPGQRPVPGPSANPALEAPPHRCQR